MVLSCKVGSRCRCRAYRGRYRGGGVLLIAGGKEVSLSDQMSFNTRHQ